MKSFLASMLGDGEGNTSVTRVIIFIVVIAVIGSKFYNAWLTKTPIFWDMQDFALVGGSFATKLVQNSQEYKALKTPATPPPLAQ